MAVGDAADRRNGLFPWNAGGDAVLLRSEGDDGLLGHLILRPFGLF